MAHHSAMFTTRTDSAAQSHAFPSLLAPLRRPPSLKEPTSPPAPPFSVEPPFRHLGKHAGRGVWGSDQKEKEGRPRQGLVGSWRLLMGDRSIDRPGKQS
ncbi:hypothetical protein CGRA01v4_02982 [Colletotrichum graminicola]|nr:hypothetical protein CGRA01v4_02982 [Colletotrichum graminicola]